VRIRVWTSLLLFATLVGCSKISRQTVDISYPQVTTSKIPNFTLRSYSNNSSCGSSKIQGIQDKITARHCQVPDAQSKNRRLKDSPILVNSGKSLKLPKPTLGKATALGFHFGKKVTMNLQVIEIDKCQALFLIDQNQPKINTYIQSGDSGSPVIQYRNGYPIVVGTMTAGITELEDYPVEDKRFKFYGGVFNHADCASKKAAN
jgi:hypothetical protein